ncbi:MAG TPA: hypothetical protein PLQ35_06265 [bacterium]|nr:hypothetical protein [bacterium]HQL61880.1 hypothetical protein [bacterium]
MPIRTHEQGDRFIISLEDRFTMDDNLVFGQTMKEAVAKENLKILILIKTKILNSYCLGTLFAGFRDLQKQNRKLYVVCTEESCRTCIHHFDPQGKLHIYSSLEEIVPEE